MSKINNDHGAGYAFGSDFSLSAFNAEAKLKKKRGRDEEMKTCRQTWAIPFNTKCANCSTILVKGVHGYINRYRARDSETRKPIDYLKIPMWDVSFKCKQCSHNIVFRTDFETSHITGGYHVISNGMRMAGDFHELMSKAAAAEDAKKIEDAKTASIPEAERKGLENQRRKEEAAKLAQFIEARKASASAAGVLSLHEQLLQEVSTTNNGNKNNLLVDENDDDDVPNGGGVGADDDTTTTTGDGSDANIEAVMERLRAELGIVAAEDGTIVDDDEDDDEEEYTSSDDNEGDTTTEAKAADTAATTTTSSKQDDLVDFFLGAVVPSKKVTSAEPSATGKVVVIPTVASSSAAPLSNDDFFAQF